VLVFVCELVCGFCVYVLVCVVVSVLLCEYFDVCVLEMCIWMCDVAFVFMCIIHCICVFVYFELIIKVSLISC